MILRPLLGVSLVALVALAELAACSGSSTATTGQADDASVQPQDSGSASTSDGGGTAQDASAVKDAFVDAGSKAAACAATFGMALTPKFGRFDGTVTAIVPPGDQACTLPNATHLVIQGRMNGEIYRMVVDVLSTIGSPDVSLLEMDAPLAGGMPWAEGWHDTMTLDYVTDLSVHNASFVPFKQAALVTKISDEITLGDHISVFATSGTTEPHSAHLVHRTTNAPGADGAIVLKPESAKAHYILLAFAEQVF